MPAEILNHPLIGQRYFFPRPERFDNPFWVDCGPARLACHYHEVDPQGLTVVHFHGNGEVVADYVDFLPGLFARFGCNTFIAEFRGYGMSTGEPAVGTMIDDIEPIINAVPSPPERIVLFGRSVGSIPAVQAIARFPQVAGLIIESGIADVLERLLLRVDPLELGVTPAQLEQAVAQKLDQRRTMAAFSGPLLVMHTVHDGLVDVEHGKRLHDWAGSEQKMLRLFERGDHNSIMMVNGEEYFRLVGEFLASLS
ncbi:MAG: alpha/beta hydrolase [Desulfuromonas sp.]|nr:MAG: alpha/beta hydrolase [Desulfuromonas sp.]